MGADMKSQRVVLGTKTWDQGSVFAFGAQGVWLCGWSTESPMHREWCRRSKDVRCEMDWGLTEH